MAVPISSVGMETTVDERGRVLIPQEIREKLRMTEGTLVQLEERGSVVVMRPTRQRRRTWPELRGIRAVRTGKPEWPTPEEIKSIWE